MLKPVQVETCGNMDNVDEGKCGVFLAGTVLQHSEISIRTQVSDSG